MAAPRSVYRRRGPQDKRPRPHRTGAGPNQAASETRDTGTRERSVEADQPPRQDTTGDAGGGNRSPETNQPPSENPMDNVEAGEDG